MGKICWINGQPYLVSIPRGGYASNDLNNSWDDIINFLGEESNGVFHWENMYSWCQESVHVKRRAVRGYTSARNWNHFTASCQYIHVGFRPVIIPLAPDTLKNDLSLLEDIPDGSRFALASLYMDGKIIASPKNPTKNGDIADYIPGTEITLGNRDRDPKNWLYVIKYRNFLCMDRNILKNISWGQLKAQGFTGKN